MDAEAWAEAEGSAIGLLPLGSQNMKEAGTRVTSSEPSVRCIRILEIL